MSEQFSFPLGFIQRP